MVRARVKVGDREGSLAHRYLIDSDLGVIIVRYWLRVDFAELGAVRQEIEADPAFRPGLNRIWDERDCNIDLTHEELAALAESWTAAGASHGKRKLVYLVNEDLSWGFNRVFEAYRQNPDLEYRLFRDYAEAKRWLGLPEDLADPRELLPEG